MSVRPITAAPPRVPSHNASRAVISDLTPCPSPAGRGERENPVIPSLTRDNNIACRTSAKRCEPSLEAEPSTPRPTLTPTARYSSGSSASAPSPFSPVSFAYTSAPAPSVTRRSRTSGVFPTVCVMSSYNLPILTPSKLFACSRWSTVSELSP